MRRVFTWGPPVVWMALIFYTSSQPDPVPAVTRAVWDKLLHLGGYVALAMLFARALRAEGVSAATASILAALLASAYGATDEVHQLFVPLRHSDVRDWIADSIGAVIGAAIYGARRL